MSGGVTVRHVPELSRLLKIPAFPNRVTIIADKPIIGDKITDLYITENYEFHKLFSTLSRIAREDPNIAARSVNPEHKNSWWLYRSEITFYVDNNTDKAFGQGRKVKKNNDKYNTLRVLPLSECSVYKNPLLPGPPVPSNPRLPPLFSRLLPGEKAIIASSKPIPDTQAIAVPIKTFRWKPKGTGYHYSGVDVFESSLHECPAIDFESNEWDDILTVVGLIAHDLVVPIQEYDCLKSTTDKDGYTVQVVNGHLIPHDFIANIPIPKLEKVNDWAMIAISSEQRKPKPPPYTMVYFFHKATAETCDTFILTVD